MVLIQELFRTVSDVAVVAKIASSFFRCRLVFSNFTQCAIRASYFLSIATWRAWLTLTRSLIRVSTFCTICAIIPCFGGSYGQGILLNPLFSGSHALKCAREDYDIPDVLYLPATHCSTQVRPSNSFFHPDLHFSGQLLPPVSLLSRLVPAGHGLQLVDSAVE